MHMRQFRHECVIIGGRAVLRNVFPEPLAKRGIQRLMLRASDVTGLFDQLTVGGQGNILHENSVHEIRVT